MNAASKSLLAVLVLALGGIGIWTLMTPPPVDHVLSDPAVQPPPVQELPQTQPTTESGTVGGKKPEPDPGRIVQEMPSGVAAEQGFFGRVIDPNGAPFEGASVFLMEGMGTNFLAMMAIQQKGVILPPLAIAKTNAQGEFRLGLDQPDPEKPYEVRVITNRFQDTKFGGRLKPKQWYDTGNIQLKVGATIQGRVTVAGSSGGLPVPNAEISIRGATGLQEMAPTPGREFGLVIKADSGGNYRCDMATPGVAHVSAVAPNFARVEFPNISIHEGTPTTQHFELAQGLSIAGIATDAAGTPVPGVRLKAIAISSKTPGHTDTSTGADGKFEIIGLLEGPYILQWSAAGFIQGEQKPIHAGDKDVRVTLEKQGLARIQVWGKADRLLTQYNLTLKSYFEGQEHFGQTDIAPQAARPDKEGITTISGVNPGNYVFQVQAAGYAMSFSDPFSVIQGVEPPLVVVRMNEGGMIEGTVVGIGDQPLAGVAVSTLPNDYDKNDFTEIFKDLMPVKITKGVTTTDSNGRYQFKLLNPGTYQLQFSHGNYAESFQKGHAVQTGQTTQIPPVRLTAGTAVTGLVTLDGKPVGQVRVSISPAQDPSGTQQQPPAGFSLGSMSATDFTDQEGKVVFKKRLPPGKYQIVGMRQDPVNPMLGLLDVMKTKQELTIVEGQEVVNVTIQMTSQ